MIRIWYADVNNDRDILKQKSSEELDKYLKISLPDIVLSAAIFDICIYDEINFNQICWQFPNHVSVLPDKYAPMTVAFWCNFFNNAPAKYTFATHKIVVVIFKIEFSIFVLMVTVNECLGNKWSMVIVSTCCLFQHLAMSTVIMTWMKSCNQWSLSMSLACFNVSQHRVSYSPLFPM